MKYEAFQYLYPPRPETRIPQGALSFYEKRGWWAQVKKNGTCTVIFSHGDEVIFMTRHNDEHKAWTAPLEIADFFKGHGSWNVFVAELIHNKVRGIRDQLYLFDQIVLDGEQLVGSTFLERQKQLQTRWNITSGEDDLLRVHPNISVAANFSSGFADVFKRLKPEDEGLVLKDPNGILKPCFKEGLNGSWQVKSRITTKNSAF